MDSFNFSGIILLQFHIEAVFSVALEHGLLTFIISCIQKLGAGSKDLPSLFSNVKPHSVREQKQF